MKVRIKFSKEGPVKFVGHLDTMRYFQKAIRRANLPVAFSGGYSPHMIMSFAAPLGVGTESLGEYFDLELAETVPTSEITRRLDAVMVEGVHVLSTRQVEDGKAGKAMSLVAAADYYVEFRPGKEPEISWKDKISDFLAQPEITVMKKTKRSEKEIDIRPFVYKMELQGDKIFMMLASARRPDNNMSRAEAAAIFARLISEQKGEKISGKSNFNDVSKSEWYSDYIGYLSKYGIIKGYADNTFRPNDNVSRAEFVAMTVRFNSLFNDVKKGSYTVKYTDVATNYWAYSDVAYAKHAGWLNGYADGTFKGDNAITRAEVVTVVNKATGRIADEGYINKNLSSLNKFTDLKNNLHWAFYAIEEASNTHIANSANNTETWVK